MNFGDIYNFYVAIATKMIILNYYGTKTYK